MPIISSFFGIGIHIFYKENKPGHFHAEHQGRQAKFDLDSEVIGQGDIPFGSVVSSSVRGFV